MIQVKEFSKRLDKIFADGNPTKALIIDAYIKTNPTAQEQALNIQNVSKCCQNCGYKLIEEDYKHNACIECGALIKYGC